MLSTLLLVLCSLLALAGALGIRSAFSADVLYIGDAADKTVKRFDAVSGAFLDGDLDPSNNPDAFVRSKNGGLAGPRGMFVDGKQLVVANENVDSGDAGAILRYNLDTGVFQGAWVPSTDKNAPFAPFGIVREAFPQEVLYVASSVSSHGGSPGKLLTYSSTGAFLASFRSASSHGDFHPRGVVFGPDGLLYVSVQSLKSDGLGGQVMRFTADGKFLGIFISDKGGVGQLNRPEGLVFGPDGRLYVTSFRANSNDTDSIRIYDQTGKFVDKINLYEPGKDRAFAQALLFGPGGKLFVPITNTGEVRRYDVASKQYLLFVSPAKSGGQLREPWYLTFGATDAKTLNYQEVVAGGPNLLRCFCQDGTIVETCAALDCFSSAEQDAICAPACAARGGEAGTGCFQNDPQCATQQQSPAGALGTRQPVGPLGR
jgi:sugar lactone lactonase YvrE